MSAQISARSKSSFPFHEKLYTYVSPRVSVENLWPLPNMKFGLWSFPAKGGVAKPNFSVSKGVINWPIKCLDNKCRCLTNKSDSHDLYVGKHQDYLL